jgi:hypothetical protein
VIPVTLYTNYPAEDVTALDRSIGTECAIAARDDPKLPVALANPHDSVRRKSAVHRCENNIAAS